MEQRTQLVFLLLILAQAAHSVEEYATRLYEVFPPARFVSSLISNNLALGFLVANVVLVTFGLWCWAIPVRSGWRAAYGLVWFWTLLELGNGIGHSANAVARKGYFPGVMTAPLLLLFAAWLAVLQARQGGQSPVLKITVHVAQPSGARQKLIGQESAEGFIRMRDSRRALFSPLQDMRRRSRPVSGRLSWSL